MNLSASHRTPGEMLNLQACLKLPPGDDDDDICFDDEDNDGIYHNDDGRGPVELKPERAMTMLLQLRRAC